MNEVVCRNLKADSRLLVDIETVLQIIINSNAENRKLKLLLDEQITKVKCVNYNISQMINMLD